MTTDSGRFPSGRAGHEPSLQAVSAVPVTIANAAAFDVGVYSDGSGPVLRVTYDMNSALCADRIWVDGGGHSDQWVAFDWQYASALCAAIMAAAKAMEARRATTGTGVVHDSAAPKGFAQNTPTGDPNA